VAYRDIARIEVADDRVTLVRSKGRPVVLPVGPAGGLGNETVHQRTKLLAEHDALAERIREAMEAAPNAAPALEPALLTRRGRTAAEWHAALRGLVARAEGGMRAAPVLPEQLWACVNDPSAEPAMRAGAAAVLATEAAPETRERLRVAARLVAQPRLRVVLEAAADGRDDALTAALARVEDEARGPQRGG
jgi:hypothetical protein